MEIILNGLNIPMSGVETLVQPLLVGYIGLVLGFRTPRSELRTTIYTQFKLDCLKLLMHLAVPIAGHEAAVLR
jgi:hypothetical protein